VTDEQLENMKISARLVSQEMLKRGWRLDLVARNYSYVKVFHPDFEEPWLFRSVVGDYTSYVNGAICDNKFAFARLMEQAGIAVPTTLWFSPTEEETHGPVRELIESAKRIVVKPIDTNHGEGVTLGVTTFESLWSAAQYALEASRQSGCIVQEEMTGSDYRFMIVGDKCVAVSGRRPAQVVGNGKDTVRQLIDSLNANPLRGEGHAAPLTRISDEAVSQYLNAEQLSQVPTEGEVVRVVGVANLSQGGEAVDITDDVHPELKKLAEKVAKQLQLNVLGVDIMTTDYTASPKEGGAVVIEANLSPGIRMHHYPSKGKPRDVAALIVDELEKYKKAQKAAGLAR
jgi:cyanophycin synthetase